MISQLTEAMIVNGVVLATVLASDLSSSRKIGRTRLLRPPPARESSRRAARITVLSL